MLDPESQLMANKNKFSTISYKDKIEAKPNRSGKITMNEGLIHKVIVSSTKRTSNVTFKIMGLKIGESWDSIMPNVLGQEKDSKKSFRSPKIFPQNKFDNAILLVIFG